MDEGVGADRGAHGGEGGGPVGRGVVEDERVVGGVRRAAARGEALGVQRRESGERGEQDAQPRVRRAADGDPRVPCGVQARDVARERRPPRGGVRRRAGDRVHEERQVEALQRLQDRAEPVDGGRGAQRVGREAQADVAPHPQRLDVGGPGAERLREPADALVVGAGEQPGLVGGQGREPSAVDSATRARSTPSSWTSAERASASSGAAGRREGASPETSSHQPPSLRRTRGALVRRARAATSGSVQTC